MSAGNLAVDDAILKASAFVMMMAGGLGGSANTIKFQFPPFVTSDNKGGNWMEKDIRADEPIPIFMGGQPRVITVNWTYIVTGQSQGGLVWDIDTVAKYVKSVRSYFYNRAGANLVINFKGYEVVGGSDTWSFRADSVNVSHSQSLIWDGSKAYPLRTDMSMQLKFFTDMSSAGAGASEPSGDEKKLLASGLKSAPNNLAWL